VIAWLVPATVFKTVERLANKPLVGSIPIHSRILFEDESHETGFIPETRFRALTHLKTQDIILFVIHCHKVVCTPSYLTIKSISSDRLIVKKRAVIRSVV